MSQDKKFVPFVSPDNNNMAEFTVRALVIGLILAVVLGAANAYLGLKAGMTIAATYPAAVIGMALIKLFKGSVLEENFARTVGSIGESIAAGAIFTLPAFFIAGIWKPFYTPGNYAISTAIMIAGGVLGIMFVALLRRVMVEDAELPFPESVAAAEIHKAGQHGGGGSKYLFGAMGLGAVIQTLAKFQLFATSYDKLIGVGRGGILFRSPDVSPAYMGVGYIIGPKLAALNFSGGVIAWGLLAPIIAYFANAEAGADADWSEMIISAWKTYVRPIAIGGMLVGAGFTLWRMRTSLMAGIARSIGDVKKAASGESHTIRTDKDISFKWIVIGILGTGVVTFFIYNYFAQNVVAALVATFVMIIAGFFFAAVSGYLVGIIGSSNNPISGLTLSTLVIAALLMVALGMSGVTGIAAVLGVAAVVCVAAAVAGEMLQDLKAGHILGGTPWKMEIGDIIGVVVASAIMFIPLLILHEGDIKMGGTGFGGANLPAPQASLMAILSQGIVSGNMEWILIFTGMLMGVAFIFMNVKSPMLVSVGMYLPLGTTFAIFVGGLIKGLVEKVNAKKQFNDAQKSRVENLGVLLAAGLIAGEALVGLLFAGLAFGEFELFKFFENPTFLISLVVFAIIAYILIQIPVKNAGRPDEPAPPSAVI
ncbi:MAG: oligopeptide transporter, OPT family [Ignavibacteria bacterium CG_4_9_14_3_um_filter_36_18]|nr:oligopeptide transporter, OPT family [Ignavibacteria bacterium]PJB01341.1 MAG: oligopeptide transporter, OPT family [Ignavibacteria bacterium CG_4_9_14_3_um_filter_36_18]